MLLNIEKLVYGGDGLARLPADEHGPGKAVFLPFVLEGEKVEASLLEQKRGFARGEPSESLNLPRGASRPSARTFSAAEVVTTST